MILKTSFYKLPRNMFSKIFQGSTYTTDALKSLHRDTIYALSSGFGKCGVSMIRVSGRSTQLAVSKMTKMKQFPKHRRSYVASLYHPTKSIMLDKAMLIYFNSPNSFTGEDVCEFHVHGGPAVVSSVLDALSTIDNLRPAEAGEFSKRAFINNKLDLTEVEGLGDLIHAETEAQRVQALSQMEGSLSTVYKKWSNSLTQCLAHVEAYIDFSEDEQLEDGILESVTKQLLTLKNELSDHLDDSRRGERLRNGVKVVIAGEPNVGKSSLLNNIVQRPAAIVSPIAGTTRDVVESTLDIGGYPVLLSDTAGLRKSEDIIESEGVARAVKKLENADIVLLMMDAEYYQKLENKNDYKNIVDNYCKKLKIDKIVSTNNGCELVVAVNKSDLISEDNIKVSSSINFLSCKTEEGMSNLINLLSQKVKVLCDNVSENPSFTQQRHRHHLTECVNFLEESIDILNTDCVISAELIRCALNEFGQVSGKISSEKILDVVFKDFCIGK